MKEIKALEILKEHRQVLSDCMDYSIIDEAIAELEALQAPKTCEWKVDDSDYNTYKTGCDQYFTLIDGNLKDNDIKYCTYCGKTVTEPKAQQ
jgi:hypothetical protein